MLGDFLTMTVACRLDIGVEYLFAVFGVLVLVHLVKKLKKRV